LYVISPASSLLSSLPTPRPRPSTLFPYTTLFRSGLAQALHRGGVAVPPDIAVHPCPQPGIGAGVQVQRLLVALLLHPPQGQLAADRKSTRLNSSHVSISYAVFCLKKKSERLMCI